MGADAPLALWIVGAIGAASVLRAVLFRAGRIRQAAASYFDRDCPPLGRNLIFTQLPAGTGAVCLALAAPAQRLATPVAAAATFLLITIAGLCLVMASRWVTRPPEYLKPDWLRQRESQMPPAISSSTSGAPPGSALILLAMVGYGMTALFGMLFVVAAAIAIAGP